MCFHYALTKQKAEIEIQLGVSWDDDWQPVYHANAFNHLKMPLIIQEQPEHVQMFNWGLIPDWVKTQEKAKEIRARTLNARSETVFEKPSYRSSIPAYRCLIPVDGFFEWMSFQKKKYPHFIQMKDEKIFCFGGIYSHWINPITFEPTFSFSVLTVHANPMLERIHNLKKRMPLFIPPSLYKKWLNPDLLKGEIESFFAAFPQELMKYHTVSNFVTRYPKITNSPEAIKPFIYPELAFAE